MCEDGPLVLSCSEWNLDLFKPAVHLSFEQDRALFLTRTEFFSAQIGHAPSQSLFFKPALMRLGIRPARWHDLRHFYASACAAQGIDIRKVSRWMGHANINSTVWIYTHLFNGSATEDMDRLDTLAARPVAPSIARIG